MAEANLKPVLVSACLLGRACRYDGVDCLRPILVERLAAEGCRPVPFCPEEAGGLGTPRPAAWIERGDAEQVLEGQAVVVTHEGEECTDAFRSGADQALQICRDNSIERAYLKEGSPSCGVCQTHVGGERVDGPGVTAARLVRSGIEVLGVD
ncbi:MAG: purine-nucleoside phosphorylase [Planctomycetes bacterium]|jgi:uncharacterized protein YbbK (DUF523 family)|nr:purine-nucleoside phosphorylase [Planctomycetota bacterium]MBV20766.1 purine-nucleoside phosphorylase [Planctomycetaceae bacterium]HJM57302.1 DUF523 domain-containing protein [Planctomycetota bacterium]